MTERDKSEPGRAPQGDADYEDEAPEASGEAEALRAENADLRDRLLRAMAEMENLRRRNERERQDTAKYAVSNFARDMVSVSDNMRRAIEHVPADAAAKDPALKNFLDGVELTERELLTGLERHGVTRLDPMGQKFDPNMHQAMFEVEDAEKPAGTVVQVMQAGYSIGERCLRPALVGVSKASGAGRTAEPEATVSQAAETPAETPPDDEAGKGRQEGPRDANGRPGGRIDRSA
jgi:molecular chaperone GrpE